MLDMLNKKQKKSDFPVTFINGNGCTKQLTVTEKNECYCYIDERTGEVVTVRRSIRTESRERIIVTREQRRNRWV